MIAPGFAQVGIDASQAAELGGFLMRDPEPSASLKLNDPETGNAYIEAEWNHAASRTTITLQPATSTRPAAAAPPAVTLTTTEAATLASFLSAGSPGPV